DPQGPAEGPERSGWRARHPFAGPAHRRGTGPPLWRARGPGPRTRPAAQCCLRQRHPPRAPAHTERDRSGSRGVRGQHHRQGVPRMSLRHFLRLTDLSPAELRQLIKRASELKIMQRQRVPHELLKNRTLAMIFEKSSTRTRVSFETAMIQLGGGSIFLSPNDSQLGRGEPIEDTARVLSEMVDAIMVRTFAHSKIETLARYSRIPVINALTDDHHPCQLLADMQTYFEHRGDIAGKTVCWVG